MSENENIEVNEAAAEEAQEQEFKFLEDPEFNVDYKGECAYEVGVTIPSVNEKKQTEELFDELQEEAQIPGFRKGRAPRKLIENRFSKAVRGDATEKLVSAAFRKLIKEQDLKPISMPDIDGLDKVMERGESDPITCTFKFEVAPRCELGKYRGLEIERPVFSVEAKDIDGVLDSVRGRFGVYESADGVEAEEGDQVVIDFKGTIDDVEFSGGSAENYPYILGSKRFFNEFEEVLKGAKQGADLGCDVTFPADYGSAEVAGKTAHFAIKVQEIKRKALPELNDEFAKQAGADSLDALRERIENELKEDAKQQSQSAAERAALDKIVEGCTFELPKTLIESSANEYFNQEIRRLANMRVPAAEIEKITDTIRKNAEEDALANIKRFVALREIGEAEGIEVTEDDFEQEAEAIQSRTGADMAVISRFMAQQEQQDEYTDRIFRRKALAVVLENAQITDKPVSREELEKAND